ncbi:WD40/YVTN/BNR-like repeat-containing protein [Fluviicola sp.]|uniref:WD40/YVTN/BNR-like repeat-containing protein n=1 Tax=Fluviicola sp. TaxID=1917219 RepID=UPI003D28CFEF
MKKHSIKVFSISTVLLSICIMLFSTCKKEEVKTSVFNPQEGQTNWVKYAYQDITEVSEPDMFYVNIKDIEFLTEDIGYMVGGNQYHEISPKMFVTLDGGLTWTRNSQVHSCGSGSEFNSLILGQNSSAFVSATCMGLRYVSSSDGLNWTQTGFDQFSNDIPSADFKLNDTILFLSSIRSINGGSSWEQLPYPVNTTDYYFSSPQYGVCVTSSGQIYVSTDLGNSWQIVYDNPAKEFNTVTMTSSNVIIAAGNCIVSGDGVNWIQVSSKKNVFDVAFLNDQIGFAAICDRESSSGEILKTSDGGQTWSSNYHSAFMGFLKLNILNEWNVFAVGFQSNYKVGKCFFVKTTTLGE